MFYMFVVVWAIFNGHPWVAMAFCADLLISELID